MAGTAVLEREIVKREEERTAKPDVSPAAIEHSRRISENYNALRFGSPVAWSDSNVREAERPVYTEAKPASASSTAQRLADYTPVQAPAKRKVLFEGLTYKDGELLGAAPVKAPAEETVTASAPVQAPVQAPASEDDALPTRRTMDTLRQSAMAAESVAAAENVGFFAALSTKTKAALIAVICTIVLAIVLICVNTSVIGSLNVDIENLRARAMEEQATYEYLQEQLEDATSTERIADYAASHGMVR